MLAQGIVVAAGIRIHWVHYGAMEGVRRQEVPYAAGTFNNQRRSTIRDAQ